MKITTRSILISAMSVPMVFSHIALSDTVIEEIVVTAQKRSERNIDVPISIASASGEDLEQAGIISTQDLAQTVPGLRVDLSGGFSQPTLRGVGSSVAGPGLSASVATYVDGIYHSSALTSAFEMADVESVQVLKGPQGTLFGRNATGGAILVTTKTPNFEPEAALKVRYGRYGDLRTTFAGSRGVNEKVALGVAAYYHENDGFVKNRHTNRNVDELENWGARIKALIEPTDNVSILLSYAHTDRRDGSANGVTAYEGRAVANDPSNPTVDPVHTDGEPIDIYSRRGLVSVDSDLAFTAKSDDFSIKIEVDYDSFILTSYTGYHDETVVSKQDYDATSLPIFHGHYQVEDDSFSQEINFTSTGSGPLQWVAGLYYFENDAQFPFFNLTASGAQIDNFFADGQKTKAYAVFADATYDLSESWFLTLGGRYSSDTLTVNFESVPQAIPYTTEEETFTDFSPRVVLRHSLSEDSSVYGSVTKGYKSGVFNAAGFSTVPVDPEEIIAYEVGYKTQQDVWALEAATFYYDYSELQVNRYVDASSILVNAAAATIYGADFQLSYLVNEKLKINFNTAYTKSEYDDFPDAPAYIGTGNPGDAYTTASIDAGGNELLRTPKVTTNLSATYDQPLNNGMLTFFGSYYYSSKFYFDAANDAHQDAYALLNLRATWTPENERYSVSIYGNNVTDEEYLVQVLGQSAAMLQQYGTPATYGVEVGFRF
jgi:iron complex outermembrane receptor protein